MHIPGQEAPLVERLYDAGNPRDLANWEGRDGYYVATCRISAADIPGLIDLVGRWNDPNWPSTDGPLLDHDDAELLPVTAWRTLADLKADSAVEPLVRLLSELDDEFDDWASEELPQVFGKIGEACIEPLTLLAANDDKVDFVRSIAVRGLRHVADYHPHTRDRVVAKLKEMMSGAGDDHLRFNTTLLTELVDLHAVEAAEAIERAYAADLVDVGMFGDWEEVRRILGVEGMGLKMPDNPHNSMVELRLRMGVGIFSDQAIFVGGEINDDAREAYYKRAFSTFSKSSEAQQVRERQGNLGWFQSLLDYGLDYLGETVDSMTPGSLHAFVFDYVPRKVSTEASTAPEIIFELTQYWKYLYRVYKLPSAKSVVEWLETGNLAARLEADLSDPANFGMAKSIFMSGKHAGYDMTSNRGMSEFVADYNRSLLPDQAPATRAVRSQHVGRNDPCPCGSGKKFKKCCGSRQRG
jgi:hypothetical protein